jgi:hypothetical protein
MKFLPALFKQFISRKDFCSTIIIFSKTDAGGKYGSQKKITVSQLKGK